MAIDSRKVGEAFVELRARMDQLDADLRKAQQKVDGAIDRVNQRSRGMGAGLSPMTSVFGKLGQGLAGLESGFSSLALVARGALAGAIVAGVTIAGQAIASAGDKITKLNAQLASVSGDVTFFDRVMTSASALGVSIDDAAAAARRFAIAGRDIGLTTEEVDKLNQTIIRLGQIGGSTPGEIATGMTQLAQAVGSTNVQWDEMRSVLESTPLVIREIADQMGMTVAELKAAGAAGQLSGKQIAEALLKATDGVAERAAQIPRSFTQASARVSNEWTALLGTLDRAFHASALVSNVTNFLGDAIARVNQLFGGGTAQQRAAAMRAQAAQLTSDIDERRANLENENPPVRRAVEFSLRNLEEKRDQLAAQAEWLERETKRAGEKPVGGGVAAPSGPPAGLKEAEAELAAAQKLLDARKQGEDAFMREQAAQKAALQIKKEGKQYTDAERAALTANILATMQAEEATNKLGQAKTSAGGKAADASAKAVAQASAEADAQRRVAEAYGQSIEAGERMASIVDAEREARSANIAIGSAQYQQLEAETIARDNAARAADKQRAAMEALRQLTLDTTALDREAASLREQASLVGQDGADLLIARKQAELKLANDEIDVQGKVAQSYLASADARNRAGQALETARENVELEQKLAEVRQQRAGLSSSADAGEIARQQAINELKREGIDLDSEVARKRIDLAGQVATETAELERQRDVFERIGTAASDFGKSAAEGLAQAIRKGEDFGSVLDKLADQLIELAIRMTITEPAGNLFGSLAKMAAAAAGGAFGGRTTTGTTGSGFNQYGLYAKGGTFAGGTGHRNEIVTRPTVFAFARGGVGLMGERGSEGILPLRRGRSGNLGVEASGMAPVVEFHVHDERRAGSPPVETRQEQGPDMRTIIRAFVRDEVGAGITGGTFDPAMQQRYNLRAGTR